jgi:hypothetical protein
VKGQRERKFEVERGRPVDVSAHVGRELQRLYKDNFTTYRRYTLSGRPERKKNGERETGRCFCSWWQGTAKAVQGNPHHLQEVHFVVGQRERKVEVERETGRCFCSWWQGTAKAYKETLTTFRRYTLW